MVLSTTDSFSQVGIKDETRDQLTQEDFISFAINVSILMKPFLWRTCPTLTNLLVLINFFAMAISYYLFHL